MNRVMVVLLAAVAFPSAGFPQAPIGPEFQVNTFTTGNQRISSVASDADGNFVVAWQSDLQNQGLDAVLAQRFDAEGTPLAPEFLLNSQLREARSVVVAPGVAGTFVAAWEMRSASGDYNVWARRFDASGNALGEEFQANAHVTGTQRTPAIATDAAGNFVVVWTSQGQDGNNDGIVGRRFDSSGTAQGLDFVVNSYTRGSQYDPAVSSDPAGNFVVAWYESYRGDVLAQRFNAAGTRQGGEFRVNTHTTYAQRTPAVASDSGGNFMVVWESLNQDGGGFSWGIFGQRYNASGGTVGGEFRVNAYVTGDQRFASVAGDPSGAFVVAWMTDNVFQGLGEIAARRFPAAGGPGPEFAVNAYTTDVQWTPAVAVDGLGNFVVTWTSDYQDGHRYGVFARQFSIDLIFADGFEG
jgi:hypothetical protein